MRWTLPAALMLVCASVTTGAQVKPQPFPKPGQQTPTGPPPAQPAPPPPVVQTAAPAETVSRPSEETLGVPIYPAAQFITSYNAGRGQRYYLFGTTATFAEIVQYYKNALKQKGEVVFEEPPVHQFDIGRFREETMAFPPSVTVKDYAWGGSAGYINPKRGADPARFVTIIQIVPNPPGNPK